MESSVNNYRSSLNLLWFGEVRGTHDGFCGIREGTGDQGESWREWHFWSGGEFVVMTFHFGSKGRCIA